MLAGMSDELHATLAAWRAGPSSDGAIAVCRAVAGGLTTSPAHRACLAEAGPQLVAAHAADVEVMVALGALYLRASELLLADAVLKRILPIAQHDPRIWRLLGEVFLRAGNARDAVTAFDGATLRGMTDAATAAWRERAGSYVAMQDTHGAGAVSAAIAGAARAAGPGVAPAAAPAPDAQRGAPAPGADTETTRTMTPLARAAEGSTPDSARTLVYQDGTGQPAPDAPRTPASPRAPSSTPPRGPVSVPRPAPSVPRPSPSSAPRAGGMPARPSSGAGIGGGITATLASASSPVRDPETPRSPQLMPAVEPISARSAAQGGSAHAPAAAPAETSIQPAGSTVAAEKAHRVSMRGAVSEGRDILDEISMSLHILRLDKAGMPQSDRDMERYLEGLRATQGLILDEPTLADDRPPVHEDGHAGSSLHTAGNAHGGQVQLAPGPRPPFDPGLQPAQERHPTQPLHAAQPPPAAGGHAPGSPYAGQFDAVPTFQPVTGGGTLPMTSVRDVLRELEQAGPPPGPMPVPVTALRPSDAAGTLPRVVVQEPPRTMVGVGPAPGAGGPPPMAIGFPAGPLAPPRDASVPPAAGLAPPVGPGLVASGPMLLARRPQKKSRAPLLVLVLVMLIVIAAGVGYAYLRYGGRL
jgi:hypothetical protein